MFHKMQGISWLAEDTFQKWAALHAGILSVTAYSCREPLISNCLSTGSIKCLTVEIAPRDLK
jgi:hypothetical protein